MRKYERKFGEILIRTNSYKNIDIGIKLEHTLFWGHTLEVDAIGQKRKTIFVFEGKSNKPKDVVTQLLERKHSLDLFKQIYVNRGWFFGYTKIRLFFYRIKGSITERCLIEYDGKGRIIDSWNFTDMNELFEILRKL